MTTEHCHDGSCHAHLADAAHTTPAEFAIFLAVITVMMLAFALAYEPLRDWAGRRELARRKADMDRRLEADMAAFWASYKRNRR